MTDQSGIPETAGSAPHALTVDLLVVGSGAGGLVAALTAATAGLRVLVIEKLDVLGGATALSGGALWIPGNSLMAEEGRPDSDEDAWTYLNGVVGDHGPATSPERKRAYLRTGPLVVDFLRGVGVQLVSCAGYPDYYSSRPGGRSDGRAVESAVFDGRRLGPLYKRLNRRPLLPFLALRSQDLPGLSNGARTLSAVRSTLGVAVRTAAGRVRGQTPLSMGTALMAQLLLAAQRHGVAIWPGTSLTSLTTGPGGGVSGAVVEHDRRLITIGSHAVVLAAGGFARNEDMRARHHPTGSTARWTSAGPGDHGDAIRAAEAVGARLDLMDEAWWMPSSVLPDGTPFLHVLERTKPHSIIVDSTGRRIGNECMSYMQFGQIMLRRYAEDGRDMSFWLILDSRNRRRYPFGLLPAAITPPKARRTGYIRRAASLAQLAAVCGIDDVELAHTVRRYNEFCRLGYDLDFNRGESAYDRYYGDPRVAPNPCMGALARAPFYAVQLFPGDIGTCGGILTDEHGRALAAKLRPIQNLYATDNCTASVMGRAYPGPGATIGPSAVFGFLAARHLVAAMHGVTS